MTTSRTRRAASGAFALLAALVAIGAAAVSCGARAEDALKDKCYALESIAAPDGVTLEVGGLCWMRDGRMMICTRRGEVWAWRDTGKTDPQTHAYGEWKRFASGLQEALGICVGDSDNDIYVCQRPELTHLIDTNRDGVADEYKTVCAQWGFSGNYHEFHFGLVRDKAGNFYGTLNLAHDPDQWGGPFMGAHPETPYRGWSYQVTPDGKFVPWSTGLRSPNGIVMGPEGDLFCTDNQGEWVASGALNHMQKGDFHLDPSGLIFRDDFKGRNPKDVKLEELAKLRKPPVLWFPYPAMGQSQTQPLFDTTGGKFGPFAGQIFVGDDQNPILMRCAIEKVNGKWQGACFPFMKMPAGGLNRLLFAPDGALYIGYTDRGWAGPNIGLQRMKWKGSTGFEIKDIKAAADGFDISFTTPANLDAARNPANYTIQRYRYNYWPKYGSPEADKTAVKAIKAVVSDGATRVHLEIPGMQAGWVYSFRLDSYTSDKGELMRTNTAYCTCNELPK